MQGADGAPQWPIPALFRRPSITSSVWASLDMLTVVVAAMLALRFRVVTPPEVSTLHVLPHLFQSSP